MSSGQDFGTDLTPRALTPNNSLVQQQAKHDSSFCFYSDRKTAIHA